MTSSRLSVADVAGVVPRIAARAVFFRFLYYSRQSAEVDQSTDTSEVKYAACVRHSQSHRQPDDSSAQCLPFSHTSHTSHDRRGVFSTYSSWR